MKPQEPIAAGRPPIVAVVGHIDHGKSTLLDYIRKTNVAAGEAGGITQHLSAYEAVHKNASGEHRITFLDTPGHEAFIAMRSRGLTVADVAVLVVSAEEGAKPQTLEALRLIADAKIPYIVAFTKIDKPDANLERAKLSLLEHQVFLEGLGGEVPWVAVSSKSGEGIPELLDLILLAAELEGLSADPEAPGRGVVIEAHVDQRRGNTATLIVQDGRVESGEYVVSGHTFSPVRIMENFLGKPVKQALPGSPVRIIGFGELPAVGAPWHALESKKEAEASAAEARIESTGRSSVKEDRPVDTDAEERLILPLVIKTDVAGMADAVRHELGKLPADPRIELRVISEGVGPVSESDVKLSGSGKEPGLIVGFNVKVEGPARELAERLGVDIQTFEVIYKLAEWLAAKVEERRPRQHTEEVSGRAKVLKFFSAQKGRIVIGGRVEEGEIKEHADIRILRRDIEIGRGKITGLQSQKTPVKKAEAGAEFGAQIKADTEPAPGDTLEVYTVVLK